ncbi:hypothetical protein ACWT_4178 [Actinoplanes sp. SE50]|uniref:hypothetical protein n=1 Tax=unclassified Actinoplanes TaxID=2626549 RepID=UPI00023EC10F|nr:MULTISPECIES: hypothetical protein [unclassified Actinoplanes]AEV85198.1 hypothetical protein ACPL_4307 [Actinoplanes sp. SE50/110]ATO83593.1 hypothetical protein ACWT_4178 [Actinoplanes sp. SE50]SLM01000.1 hypothetical protein ACSP50_4233 [Actinoplanes sp. SE50/110]
MGVVVDAGRAGRADVRDALAGAGFVVEGFLDHAELPAQGEVWRPFIMSSARPVKWVRHESDDHDARVDRLWHLVSRRNGTIDADGAVLLSLAQGSFGPLPWIRVRVGESLPRVAGFREFVALSPTTWASSAVSEEEYATWILADPLP